MSDTDQNDPSMDPQTNAPQADPHVEPVIDHSMFRMELGKVEGLIAHIKDWVRWHLKQQG